MPKEKEVKFKQVMTPHKEVMAENIPALWEFVKSDLKTEHIIKFGGETGVYVYKRISPIGDKVLSCRIEFIEFEEDRINNVKKS